MNKLLSLLLAAFVVASAPAFAGDVTATLKYPAAESTQDKPVLDYKPTGSVKRIVEAEPVIDHSAKQGMSANGQKLGIDVNPWMMPTF